MNIRLSAPSKTFLIGEYAVLVGGPALVVNTAPRFSFLATRLQSTASPGSILEAGIAAASPAGQWLGQNAAQLSQWTLQFVDPHEGRGGFGASSAQFVFAHAFTTFLQSSVSRAVAGYDLKTLWNDFQTLSGGQASGADVLAQTVGGVALVDMQNVRAEAHAWPFADLGFAVARTNKKLPTHEHLSQLKREPLNHLLGPTQACVESFVSGGSERFVTDAKNFVQVLRSLKLQTEDTLALTTDLEQQPWCLLSKGCGALGADTILTLFAPTDRNVALAELKNRGLEVVASDSDLALGLDMNWSWN